MKRNTAIVAAIVAVVVIVAAAVGVMLLNPFGDSGDQGPGDVPGGRPGGSEGVSGAVVNIGTNESNASAFDELIEEFQNTSEAVEEPDALCQVAITNNQTEEIELDCSNFTATLIGGGEVQSLNRNVIIIGPNSTVYVVLGFQTNGSLINAISYTGDVELGITAMSEFEEELGPMVMMEAPENITEIENLTFESPSAWTITNGSMSPMPLFFNEDEVVILALVIGTNNQTSAIDIEPGDFWLDLGNGTWVQAEEGRNHNLVRTLEPDTAIPFMVGFRLNATVTPSAIYYWPDQDSNQTVRFEIDPQQPPQEPRRITVSMVWDERNETATRLFVALNDTGDTPGDVSLMGWSMKDGLIAAETTESNITNGTVYVFELQRGDDITLLQYEDAGQTRYIWLRPVVPT